MTVTATTTAPSPATPDIDPAAKILDRGTRIVWTEPRRRHTLWGR